MTRYPEVRVRTRTANPMLLVAVVRQELRRAGVAPREIDAFSAAALGAADETDVRRVCGEWVDTRPAKQQGGRRVAGRPRGRGAAPSAAPGTPRS